MDASSYIQVVDAKGRPDGLVTVTWRHAISDWVYPSALRTFR